MTIPSGRQWRCHCPSCIKGIQVVVYSSAARDYIPAAVPSGAAQEPGHATQRATPELFTQAELSLRNFKECSSAKNSCCGFPQQKFRQMICYFRQMIGRQGRFSLWISAKEFRQTMTTRNYRGGGGAAFMTPPESFRRFILPVFVALLLTRWSAAYTARKWGSHHVWESCSPMVEFRHAECHMKVWPPRTIDFRAMTRALSSLHHRYNRHRPRQNWSRLDV